MLVCLILLARHQYYEFTVHVKETLILPTQTFGPEFSCIVESKVLNFAFYRSTSKQVNQYNYVYKLLTTCILV